MLITNTDAWLLAVIASYVAVMSLVRLMLSNVMNSCVNWTAANCQRASAA